MTWWTIISAPSNIKTFLKRGRPENLNYRARVLCFRKLKTGRVFLGFSHSYHITSLQTSSFPSSTKIDDHQWCFWCHQRVKRSRFTYTIRKKHYRPSFTTWKQTREDYSLGFGVQSFSLVSAHFTLCMVQNLCNMWLIVFWIIGESKKFRVQCVNSLFHDPMSTLFRHVHHPWFDDVLHGISLILTTAVHFLTQMDVLHHMAGIGYALIWLLRGDRRVFGCLQVQRYVCMDFDHSFNRFGHFHASHIVLVDQFIQFYGIHHPLCSFRYAVIVVMATHF